VISPARRFLLFHPALAFAEVNQMNKMLSGLLLLLLAACANEPPAPLGPPVQVPTGPGLSADEIRSQLVGKTGSGPISGSNATQLVYFAADGTGVLKIPAGTEQGKWRIAPEGQICETWERYRGGQEYCQRVYRQGDVYQLVNSNSVEVLRFVAGKTF
jgi:hypothetical protein